MSVYYPHTSEDEAEMLARIGAAGVDELYSDVPQSLRAGELNLPSGMSESEAEEKLEALASKNRRYSSVMRGAGAYRHYIPKIVDEVASKSSFLTAYTPYQAEMSQGVLQSIFEYQTYIARLTGMEAANASMYSGATAAAEAVMQCVKSGKTVAVSRDIRPDTKRVLETYLENRDIKIKYWDTEIGTSAAESLKSVFDADVAAVYVEQPAYSGEIVDLKAVAEFVHSAGAKLIAGGNPLAYALIPSPGECGADVAVGDAQPFGQPLSFGGAYLGYYAVPKKDVRKMPGRIVGQTTDRKGNIAYVLTLQPREQHIKRERALSNICSNQALCALRAAAYLAAMGGSGLYRVALNSYQNAHFAAKEFEKAGLKIKNGEFFNEFVTISDGKSEKIEAALKAEGILSGLKLNADEMLWCFTELNGRADIGRAALMIKEIGGAK